MSLISDKMQKKRLDEYGINIKTKYIVGDKILERNTDGTVNDDISNGIRCSKEYYLDKRVIHTEKEFDSRIEYTFVSLDTENDEYTCSNCGMHSKIKDFIDGCPYCGTYYNIDYTDKELGNKYHYDRVLRSNTYRIVTLIIDVIISIVLSYFFIKTTSRTFNNYDILKVFIYGIILALVLYYLFYILDAYVVLGPIKRFKDKQNEKQIDFWNRTKIDKKIFFNNLNYEISKYYYEKEDIIDYDILDYIEFRDFIKDEKLLVEIVLEVRKVYFEDKKIKSKVLRDTFVVEKHNNEVIDLKDGVNMIKCYNCGASIDATKGMCSYCHSKINNLQEWLLVNDK